VANEVKNLANQTTTATSRISEQITAMQSVSTEVVKTLEAISTAVVSVQDYVTGAASAIEEQSVVTQDISSNMRTAARGVENITKSLCAWR
jgi:methyl-accepting chemotaxis protein